MKAWTRFPIARLRYTKAANRWSLYWRDRHLRFHHQCFLWQNLMAPRQLVIFCTWCRGPGLSRPWDGTTADR